MVFTSHWGHLQPLETFRHSWSWLKMLNGLTDENLRKAVGAAGVEGAPGERRSPWLGEHGHGEFETSPFLREVGFQAAGLWVMAELGRMALPAGGDRILLSPEPAPEGGLRTLVRLRGGGGADAVFDIWTCDEDGRCFDQMLG